MLKNQVSSAILAKIKSLKDKVLVEIQGKKTLIHTLVGVQIDEITLDCDLILSYEVETVHIL